MLVLLWCGISIFIQSSENGSKVWKILKISIFTMIVDVSKRIFEDESNRKAMNRNWSNQKANPALKTKAGNK